MYLVVTVVLFLALVGAAAAAVAADLIGGGCGAVVEHCRFCCQWLDEENLLV